MNPSHQDPGVRVLIGSDSLQHCVLLCSVLSPFIGRLSGGGEMVMTSTRTKSISSQ